MDESLFRAINSWPESFNLFFHFLSEGNKTWTVRVVFALIVLVFVWKGGKWRAAAILAVLAWLISNEVCDILKAGFQGLRPCVALPESEVILRVKKLTSFGTASAHAASMAAVAFAFTSLLGRWGWPWIALAFFVGLSRIYVGVHFPSQVLLGWLVGCLVSFIAVQSYNAVLRLRASKREAGQETNAVASNPEP